MKPMTHGEIRGTLLIAALLAAILVAVAFVRSCKSPGYRDKGCVVEYISELHPEAFDSVIAADKAGAYLRADSLRKAERDSLRKVRRDSLGRSGRYSRRGAASDRKKSGREPVKMNDSPVDRGVPE